MSFSRLDDSGSTFWHGDPDCDAAHAQIAAWLQEMVSGFLPPGSQLSTRVKGNMSEAITLRIGRTFVYSDASILASALKARQPLSDISRDGVDIVWLHFGDHAADDWVALQEVKATGNPSLLYAEDLLGPLRWRTGHEPQDRGKSSQISTLKAFASFSRFTIDTFRSPRSAELT